MKIKCLAIDDEPFALKQLVDYIQKTPFLELAEKCSSAFEALEKLTEGNIDLIFVDINMPGMSGMELVKSLPPDIMVVFTTAYSEYAVESYKVSAVDYLLKPISYEDFLRSANKAMQHFIKKPNTNEKQHDDHFFVKSDGKTIKIVLSEIDFIESMSEYVKIFLGENKVVISLMSMKSLEASLPSDRFMRVHRSYIVNLDKIATIERNRIVFYNNTYIPVSDQYKDEFKKFIDNSFL
ncbi:MAG: DNA-binding response regulator [Bacteroidetes bacterium HGW-Bacteroidetes-6]|jgi:two-component system LytT family response regulator|nr:MAG: DNA-binding response regulator [Bacteroidetes bacterium HGW-Bacteroidetes-6]